MLVFHLLANEMETIKHSLKEVKTEGDNVLTALSDEVCISWCNKSETSYYFIFRP